MYKLFLCLRYLRKRRIAFFAVAAVCLCVAMVLIVISVMGGFLQMVKDRSRGLLGDLVMENRALQGFPFYQEFIDQMKSDPELKDRIYEATPVIINYAVLRFPSDMITKPTQIVGIRLEETYRVNEFKNGLFYEKHYPGSTTLAPQREPRYGMDDAGRFVLPPELEAARKKWEAAASREEIRDAWRFKNLLFSIEAGGYAKELNRRTISAALREEFANWGVLLADDATVSVEKKSSRWRLDQHNGAYIIEKDDSEGRLNVYRRRQYAGPGFYAPIPLELYAVSSGPAWYGEEVPGIIIGTDLCARRRRSGDYDRDYYRGEPVQLTMLPITDTGQLSDATGAPTKLFRYADDCRTGVYDIDSMSVYVDFDLLQHILKMDEQQRIVEEGSGEPATIPARATQVQIKLDPGVDVLATRDLIQKKWNRFFPDRIHLVRAPELLRQVIVQTWEEKQHKFIAAVEKEKYLVTILFGIISLVAVLLVGCIFYMIVQQKTRDIGVIRSVGATSAGVAQIFLAYGAAVGIVGGALGTVIGTLFVWYINEIQDLLARINPQAVVWNPEVYTFDRIPSTVNPRDAIVIYIIAIIASMAGALIAAVRAARVWPVEALRYE